jgi:putative ABC transport system permease protein
MQEEKRLQLLFELIRKDIMRNKVVTIVLVLFLVLSSLLLASGLQVTGTMISSLNGLDRLAQPPDYLQMHKGEFDEGGLNQFIAAHPEIQKSQVIKARNIGNINLVYRGETLEKFLMDNGFIAQNVAFDYLLDTENKIATVQDGEIGVPVYYAEELGIEIGENFTVRDGDYEKTFVVSTIVRDASMNAALASSKRFLVTKSDLAELNQHTGEWEYSIEFLLEEGTDPDVLEKSYLDAGLPSNGVMITGLLLTLLNNVSYGLVALIIIAISLLMIVIGMLCLSYIIRASLAEESATIGELKAIGFPGKDLKRLYLLKYIAFVAVAGLVGYVGAIPLGEYFSESVVRYCGQGTWLWMKWVLSLAGIILFCIVVILGSQQVIKKNLKISVVELLRGDERTRKEGHYKLPVRGLKFKNISVAMGELKCKWRESIVLFLVFLFSSFLILLPLNMLTTVNDPSFITYMGVGQSDIRMDLQYNDNLIAQRDAAVSFLEQDLGIEKFAVYRVGYVQTINSQGEQENIRVTSGDESIFPLAYQQGIAPTGTNEIALSTLNAEKMGKQVGDKIVITYKGQAKEYRVSGVYQDITYGGKTAKAAIGFEDTDVEVYIIYVNLKEQSTIAEKTKQLRETVPAGKVTPITEFISQTVGGITKSLTLVKNASIVMSLLLIMLISLMVLRLMIAREHRAIAIKKALGFTNRDLRMQLGIRILAIQFLAIAVGTDLANSFGGDLLGVMLSTLGASTINLLIEPVSAYVYCPLSQLLVATVTIILATRIVKAYHIRDQIIE